MDKREATTKVIVAMIENNFFVSDIRNKNSEAGSKAVAEAYKEIFDAIDSKIP